MKHTDRIPTRTDHLIAFLTGATVCLGATLAGVLLALPHLPGKSR